MGDFFNSVVKTYVFQKSKHHPNRTLLNTQITNIAQIDNTTLADSGEYTVTAVNYEGEDEESMEVLVILSE